MSQARPKSSFFLLLISFIEGGAVMVIELLGAKIIAPFYGTSLYVWSSVLGVTLAALAVGYFTGGVLSKKYPGKGTLFTVLLIGAFFTGLAPLIAPEIMSYTEWMGVRMGSLTSVLIYLLPPISCMGMVSPLIIQMLNEQQNEAGKVAGTVYALSTVGGILATFLAGFYMLPELGIKTTAFITAGVLGGMSITYFVYHKKNNSLRLGLFFFILLSLYFKQSIKEASPYLVYQSTGLLGEWSVLDRPVYEEEQLKKIDRKLILNGIDQTFTTKGLEPLSVWTYPHKLAAYASMKPANSKALLLGFGGGSIAYELLEIGMNLDIVEIDERLAEIATNYFNYDPSKSNLYIDDARHFIRQTDEKYDVVLFDIVLGEVQPAHVFTQEGFEDLKRILNPDALVIINFQGDIYDIQEAIGSLSIMKTLEAVGFKVNFYTEEIDDNSESTNDIFFIASQIPQNYSELLKDLRYNYWSDGFQYQYEDLITDKELDLSTAFILKDDQPKLEQLNAPAILAWRRNKMRANAQRMLQDGIRIY